MSVKNRLHSDGRAEILTSQEPAVQAELLRLRLHISLAEVRPRPVNAGSVTPPHASGRRC